MKKKLNLAEVIFISIGIILGAGIYALIGQAAKLAGNAIWVSSIFGGIMSIFTGLSYAYLSLKFPSDSSEYIYAIKAFNKKFLALIISSIMILSGLIGIAVVTISFAQYFYSLYNIPLIIPKILLIILFGFLIVKGIKESSYAIIIGTIIESIGLIIVIILAIPYIGNVNYIELPNNNIGGIFEASIMFIFAYIGFELITRLSEETENPTKTIPKAIIISIIICGVLYMLVSISAVSILGWENLSHSNAPFSEVVSKIDKNLSLLIGLIAVFATANTTLGLMLTAVTQISSIIKMNPELKIFNLNDEKKNIIYVTTFVVLMAILFILIKDLKFLATLSVFLILIVFIFVNLCAIVINLRTEKNLKQLIISLLGILTCGILTIYSIKMLF